MMQDYRDWLKKELQERTQNNPCYSLRAFARDLKISPSSVSLILNGKKGLSKITASKVATALGWSKQDQQLFKALVLIKHSRSKSDRVLAEALLAQHQVDSYSRTIEHDTFKVMSDWYHFGILQLTPLKGFKSEIPWIAKKLDVPEYETREAVARLMRLGLLRKNKEGRYHAAEKVTVAPGGVPSEALRKFHRQMIEKAMAAIERQSFADRHLYSSLIPISKKRFHEITAKIQATHEHLVQKYGDTKGDADELYGFCTQFYRMTPKPTEVD